jgi:hypothetical protein
MQIKIKMPTKKSKGNRKRWEKRVQKSGIAAEKTRKERGKKARNNFPPLPHYFSFPALF